MKLAKKYGNFIHSSVQYLQSLMNRRGNFDILPALKDWDSSVLQERELWYRHG